MEPDGPELFAAWGAMVRVCERVLGSREDAEDCASEALLQAFSEGVDDVENVEAWLVAIAKRRAMDVLRRRVRNRRQLLKLASRCDVSDPDPAERVADEAEARWLSAQADTLLTAPARAVLRVVADGGSVNDAAHRLAMTRRSAESHLHRARLTLRAARVALPAFAMAVLRSVRKPTAASSVALVASVAVVAPAFLTPAMPDAPAREVATPLVSEVTSTSPDEAKPVVVRRRTTGPVSRTATSRRVTAPVRTPATKRHEVARVPTSAAVVSARWEERGPQEAVPFLVYCVERIKVVGRDVGC
ncbi:MAG TPA: sigma-70 family RNA polymerase sigma factor [Frankiaceae bacterium]|nr:sigma-70 family RNA polymerase sigma factor [Frankiaceae bacterium]